MRERERVKEKRIFKRNVYVCIIEVKKKGKELHAVYK